MHQQMLRVTLGAFGANGLFLMAPISSRCFNIFRIFTFYPLKTFPNFSHRPRFFILLTSRAFVTSAPHRAPNVILTSRTQ
jgi:hypothetical protein